MNCPFESDVLRAAANDAGPESLRAHVASCEECAAAAAVAPWMESFAKIDERRAPLPDPTAVWLRAKLMQSTAAAQRAALPITRLQMAAYLIIATGWAGLLTLKWQAIQAWLHALNPGGVIQASAATNASLSLTVLFSVIGLLSATVMLAFHTVLAEE